MRKTLLTFMIVLLVLTCSIHAQAVGTVVASELVLLDAESGIYMVTYTCTADSAAATFPATALTYLDSSGTSQTLLSFFQGWHLYRIRINPGVTAPTDNYGITILEQGGDVCGDALLLLDTADTEFRAPAIASAGASVGIGGATMADTWTVTFDGVNAVNSAIVVFTLFFTK